MKRPLVAVVSCYATGCCSPKFFNRRSSRFLPLRFSSSSLALPRRSVCAKAGPRKIRSLVDLAAAGARGLDESGQPIGRCFTQRFARGCSATTSAIVTVRGTLIETPHLRITERDGQQTERSVAQVRVTALCRNANWQPAAGSIIVTTPGAPGGNFFAGQPVEISGVIGQPPPPLAEGLFDYRDYLRTRGIYYQLKTGSTNDWQLGAAPLLKPPLTDRFLNWSQTHARARFAGGGRALRLLWAMTLGWRTALTADISEPFLRAGTMHLFAIDGLRIALISGMLVALLRLLQISRAWCGIVAIPVIWFYTAATGWESSAIRASVMMTIVIGGWALKRPGDLINSLAAAAFIILLWEPRQLFEASFQLSFFVVLVIGLMLPPLNKMFDRLWQGDPLLPDELLPRWRRALIATLRMLSRYFALSFAAWIGSIPLAAKYFHLFSPVSTPANIVAVPLGTLALMSNLGALVCGTWFPWATGLFNHSAWFFMCAMTWVSELATKIPGAFFYVPAPSWLDIALFYAVLVGALSGWLFAPKRRIWSATALVLVVAGYAWHWQATRHEIELTVLPLNGGHAVWVDAPGRKNDWLVNCGDANAVGFTLKPFLRAQGVNHLSRLALTYGSARNNGGAVSLNELFGVDELVTSPHSISFRRLSRGGGQIQPAASAAYRHSTRRSCRRLAGFTSRHRRRFCARG